jgi:hypothetical protein
MRNVLLGMAVALSCLLLAGCNTTDALTPQVDIPGATQPNGNNQTKLAEADRPVADNNNQPVALDDSVGKDSEATNARPPQNTLEAQAQALQSGRRNPSLTDPGDNPMLGANLYKNSEAKRSNNLYSADADPVATNAATTPAAIAKRSIRFLPIIGAPVQAVTPLSRELGNSARANGLTIKSSSDQTAAHVLKGYLSAFGDGKTITVIYVWDILDNGGNRLHRIQGQQSIPGAAKDAWSAVPPEMMQQIGVSTIAEYLKWNSANG